MSKLFIEDSTLTAIGNAIRTKEGSEGLIPTTEMAERIANLPSGGGGINYSMEEQDTGLTWIDGKKIYQKTVDVPLGRVYESEIYHGISNFNELISIEGTLLTVDQTRGNLYRSFPFVYSGNGGTNYTISIYDFDKTSFVFVRGGAYYTNNTNIGGKFTFRYTKTTD